MKAMGFKDRGHSKYCFKNYEDSPDEDDDDEDSNDQYGQYYLDSEIYEKVKLDGNDWGFN